MNKKMLQRGLRLCLMVLALMLGSMILPMTTVKTQAATDGFKTINGKTYYVTKIGSYRKGFLTVKGKTYYFNSKGVMQKGWTTVRKKKYYFDANGVMATGWKTLSKKNYYFDANGVMQTGFLTLDGKTYYLKSNGAMATGWMTNSKGQKRYFSPSTGVMATGWMTNSKGQKRYFAKNTGIMAKGWTKNSVGSYRYFSKSSGIMFTGMQKVGNFYYYFRKSSGTRYQKGLGTVSGKTYYFSKSTGKRLTGWATISKKKYYFGSDGVMYKSTTATINGKRYIFDSTGVATEYTLNSAVDKTGLTIVDETSTYVMVTDKGRSSSKQYKLDITYLKHPGVADGTLSDLDLLAAVCDAEANDQGVIGMQAVAMCLLNRTLDTYYPASLRGVVYQRAPGIQYAVVIDGALAKRLVDNKWQQKENAYAAAKAALEMFDAYVKNGTKRTLKGFDRDDFDFKFFMMESSYWAQSLNFSKVDSFLYKDHMFFVDWV